jgi:hypothetical protein
MTDKKKTIMRTTVSAHDNDVDNILKLNRMISEGSPMEAAVARLVKEVQPIAIRHITEAMKKDAYTGIIATVQMMNNIVLNAIIIHLRGIEMKAETLLRISRLFEQCTIQTIKSLPELERQHMEAIKAYEQKTKH